MFSPGLFGRVAPYAFTVSLTLSCHFSQVLSKVYVVRPSLPLKARHLGGSAFCNFYGLGVPEQALCGIPLGFGIIVEDKPSELSFTCTFYCPCPLWSPRLQNAVGIDWITWSVSDQQSLRSIPLGVT